MIVTANQVGIDKLKALGAKLETANKIYLEVRDVWFEFKRNQKAKKKTTRALYAAKLREFYDKRVAKQGLFATYVDFRGFLNENPPYKTVTKSSDGRDRQRSGFDFDKRVAASLTNDYLGTYTSAGSRSAFDVIAIPKRNGKTIFAQCKLNRRLEQKDVKALAKFLAKAPAWAEVRLYFEEDGQLAYSKLSSEKDLAWFATTSNKIRTASKLKEPKIVIATTEEVVEAATTNVDIRALMLRLKWTGRVGLFQDFYNEVSKLWPAIVGCRYNLAKSKDVDVKFQKLYKKYDMNFGVQSYVVFKVLRIKMFEPKVSTPTSKLRDLHRELTGKTEYTALKQMSSGALYICRTDKTSEHEIAHVIRVRGDKLELAFCRANGLISKTEHTKLSVFIKQLPKYASIRFYFYVNGKKIAYKDMKKNLDWFTTQRGVELRGEKV